MEDLDCVVIGGGVAGLSAALVLGRARRRLLVVDAGEQSNLAADGIGGLLGSDRRPPADLYAQGRRELAAYPSTDFRHDRVVTVRAGEKGFEVETEDGLTARSSTLVLAPGMDYRYPDVAGLAERWGHGAFHCPFCHGWEVSGRPLGFLGDLEHGAERGLMLRAWSDDVTVFTNGSDDLGSEARERLDAAGVAVEERVIAALRGPGRELESIGFSDGTERPLGGLLVQTELHQRSDLATSLGLRLGSPNPVVKDPVKVDGRMAASVPGVFAAGDAAAQMPSIQNSIAAGAMAAAGVIHELTIARAPAPVSG
ncbi:NAD(P)/FAD-dependent oxidoreductase [Thermoleophilia bacterium SCSIO 60948]|nr:NAD(P)/FAD-dependent oxidoreductase [Thermoleophilia bacterium SCSIO 60948]